MNSTPDFDFLVFIGRFQPVHLGHLQVLREGLRRARHVVVLIGSAHMAPTLRNPWAHAEREAMIRGAFDEADGRRLLIAPLMDVPYNDEAWVRNVQATVEGLVTAHHDQPHREPRIGLIGHRKDHTAYYLKLFPQWESVAVDNYRGIDATAVRTVYFRGEDGWKRMVPENVVRWLERYRDGEGFRYIREEQAFIERYRAGWAKAPYPPVFVTVDAVVVQSGHVLLVERRARPGKGLLALPGGFVQPDERLEAACLRELREETRLRVPAPVLQGHVRARRVFDEPNRSSRGRTITHAFYIELPPAETLPKVRGGDDARHARWLPLAALEPARLFEDHYFIIREMTGT